VVADLAIAACNDEVTSRGAARALYQRGRAWIAGGNFPAARRDLEQASSRGYAAAQVELGMLAAEPSRGMLDVRHAEALYEHAWRDGVAVAAFELGQFYEHGITAGEQPNHYVLAPDEVRAWSWYQAGAGAGEANSLARFAERADHAALVEQDPTNKNRLLLEAFKYYAAAAGRGQGENWPNETWRGWRYRRASLARLLARAGMMREVAETYDDVRIRYAVQAPTLWDRAAALVHGRERSAF
jgi:TPR repeat protein